MKERPILFSTPMVRANMEDRKTQTRRIVKLYDFQISTTKGYDWEFRDKQGRWHSISNERLLELCPYGKPGDRLWVRETFLVEKSIWGQNHYEYKADYSETMAADVCWKPSIFMPREACRIILEITDVRVERLQNISEHDAQAEGVERPILSDPFIEINGTKYPVHPRTGDYVCSYMVLWNKINGKGSWDKNPWVWCISFKRL